MHVDHGGAVAHVPFGHRVVYCHVLDSHMIETHPLMLRNSALDLIETDRLWFFRSRNINKEIS